jgi:hypothetical protein
MTDPFLTFDMFELRGPVGYDEKMWRAAEIPAEYPQAYVLTARPGVAESYQVEWIGYDSLCGVARRLRGLARPALDGEPWADPFGAAPDPWVHAAVELTPDQTIGLLEPYLTGLQVSVHDEITREYRLDADGVAVWCDPCSPTIYPLVRTQAWFTSADATTDYQFTSDPDTDAPARVAVVARVAVAAQALAAATGGLVLDEDGYPWPEGG